MKNTTHQKALEYVFNTNGGATPAVFIEDFAPIGGKLWLELTQQYPYLGVNSQGRVVLTRSGEEAFALVSPPHLTLEPGGCSIRPQQ